MSGGVPAGFTDNGAAVPLKRVAHTAVHYAAWMAAVVASRRGGETSDHIAECYGFLAGECVRGVTPLDPLPKGYDWSAAGAIDTANALLEYDA